MGDETPAKRWTAKLGSVLVIDIFKGKTKSVAVTRWHDRSVAQVERWILRIEGRVGWHKTFVVLPSHPFQGGQFDGCTGFPGMAPKSRQSGNRFPVKRW